MIKLRYRPLERHDSSNAINEIDMSCIEFFGSLYQIAFRSI